MSERVFIVPHTKNYYLKKKKRENTKNKEFNIEKLLSNFRGECFIDQYNIYDEEENECDKR